MIERSCCVNRGSLLSRVEICSFAVTRTAALSRSKKNKTFSLYLSIFLIMLMFFNANDYDNVDPEHSNTPLLLPRMMFNCPSSARVDN